MKTTANIDLRKEDITFSYKGHKVRVRRDTYSRRANGYWVFMSYGLEFFKTRKSAMRFIDSVEG